MKKFSRCSLLGLICIWFIMGTPVLAQAPEQNLTDMTTLIRQLQQAGGNKVRVAYHRETGRVRFIGAAPDQPVGQPALRTNASSEEAARQFLTDYGALFGLKEPTQELKVMKEAVIDPSRSFIRFQQTYHGIPVLGGELIVQLDGRHNILSANGEIWPDIQLDTQPKITPEAARQTALQQLAKDYGVDVSLLKATDPELWLYQPGLLGGPGIRLNRLVWRIEVSAGPTDPIRAMVLVDAQLGGIALHINQIETSRNRMTYNAGNTTTLPGTLVCNESSPNCSAGDSHAQAAHIYAGDTYDFYETEHGRDGIDDAGETLISTVHYSTNYANAFWNGQQMVYGDAYAFPLADDVVGHELTHGVTDRSSQLFYYYQSGAINESLSDVWGEFIDLTNGAGDDSDPVRWLMGEDITGLGAIRSMKDPTAFFDPDKMSAAEYNCDQAEPSTGSGDNGGVHANSGVNNKAVYLMVDGGSFNSYTITGLGIPKIADLYYEVQTNLLTSAADYADLYDALLQAAVVLGYSSADQTEIKKALDAVEMSQLPAACPPKEALICETGSPNYLYFDDMESGSSNWVSNSTQGTAYWFLPQTDPASFLPDPYAVSGVGNIWGYDQEALADTTMAMKQSVALPANASLHFAHAYGFESSSQATSRYDGGILEYSTNNGMSWQNAAPLIAENGYNGQITDLYDNPLGGQDAFTADSRGYISSRLDLSSLAGQPFRLRFRIGTDGAFFDYGWFIDDVRIYTCSSANSLPRFLSNGLPNFNFNTNPTSGEPLNLWYFADDYETADNNLSFSFCNTPATGAGVTINQNRYLNIAPASDWEDQTDVCIEVEDEEGGTAQETFSIIKGELNQRLYLPLIRH